MIGLVREQVTKEKLSELVTKIALLGLDHLWQVILVLFITLFLIFEGQMLADKVKVIFGPSAVARKTRPRSAGKPSASRPKRFTSHSARG